MAPTSADGPNVKLCRNGYWYEASVAEQIFQQMLADEGPRIQLHLRQQLRQAAVENGRLASVVAEDRRQPGRLTRWQAPVFIDATYEGDLAALAGAAYRVGRESRAEYGEPHAGKVYVRFGERDLLPGSTGEADQAIQGFCFRFHVTQDPGNRVTVTKPEDYRPRGLPSRVGRHPLGPGDAIAASDPVLPDAQRPFELNSDHPHPDTGVPSESFDLAEENWGWPEATPDERQRIYRRYLSHNVGLLWFLQSDPEVPEAIRREASQFGWCRDLWPDNGHVPRQVYVRQGRRILGEYVLTQRDGDLDPALQRTRLQPTSIAIVEFAFDSHGTRKFDPAHPGVREGTSTSRIRRCKCRTACWCRGRSTGCWCRWRVRPVMWATTRVRMEPVFMALGEASGTAAHVAVQRKVPVRSVPVAQVQHLLVAHGAVITHYDDLPFDHPAFAAFQWLGARGLNLGYRAQPELKLTRRGGWERLGRVLQAEQRPWKQPSDAPDAPLLGKTSLSGWAKPACRRTTPSCGRWGIANCSGRNSSPWCTASSNLGTLARRRPSHSILTRETKGDCLENPRSRFRLVWGRK